jgi:hypothetical protein
VLNPRLNPASPPAAQKSLTGRKGFTKSNNSYRLIIQRDGKRVRLMANP